MPSSPTSTPYSTVTGAESRMKLAFDAIFRYAYPLNMFMKYFTQVNIINCRKSAHLQDADSEHFINRSGSLDGKPRIIPLSPSFKKVQLVSYLVLSFVTLIKKEWIVRSVTLDMFITIFLIFK